ncbi:universal stress protein [Winogradskyella alexanderae]|uniref:Universal stress protein n=1 Tax=Winogradskyella alexanderae TaxID=2877123 RepID=A0ABS7XM97_9FLAO|nr:universal stress protein [Winogradskyella alexanderae]MCA0131101.1 universal stress protein [Winogradskyella alexanderae]
MARNQKILILSDLKSSTPIVLNNAIALAKMIQGDLEFLHVKKPTELVKTESQLSAVRSINESTIIAKKKIKKLLDPLAEKHKTKVNYKYSFGNIKNEIETFVKKSKPDIIVLGKRKSNRLSFVGDNIIDFVLKSHKGAVLVVSHNSNFSPDNDLSIGIFNKDGSGINGSLIKALVQNAISPIKLFKIGSTPENLDQFLSKKAVEYVFEDTTDVISNISSYIPKSRVNLLCLNRTEAFNKNKTIKDIIKRVNVSILII